jgi:S-DNA-T family DNA segregation ATPase FtsK/SpoIIIE
MDQTDKKDKLRHEIKGMVLAAAGLFILLALVSFNTIDSSPNSFSSEGGYRNFCGMFGAQIADILLEGFGLAAYLIPSALLYLAYRLLRFKELRWRVYKGVAFIGLLISMASMFAFWDVEKTEFLGQKVSTGGLFGIATARILKDYMGVPGALLLLLHPLWRLVDQNAGREMGPLPGKAGVQPRGYER